MILIYAGLELIKRLILKQILDKNRITWLWGNWNPNRILQLIQEKFQLFLLMCMMIQKDASETVLVAKLKNKPEITLKTTHLLSSNSVNIVVEAASQ